MKQILRSYKLTIENGYLYKFLNPIQEQKEKPIGVVWTMIEKDEELVIIGGGPAGLAAAISAYRSGIPKPLIVERNPNLGGILGQCIHDGFGLEIFKESLTGPEYMERYIH